MRRFIRFCASVFVIMGGGVFVIGGLLILVAFIGAVGSNSTGITGIAVAASFGIAFITLFAGASTTLVGGATYLLATIDERLEKATGTGGIRPNSDFEHLPSYHDPKAPWNAPTPAPAK